MPLKKPRIRKGIQIVPDTDALESLEGEIKVDSADSKIKTYLGATAREVLTNSQTQTVTSKTIVAASNTITTAAAGNLAATELNAALAELDGDITTVSGGLSDHLADTVDSHDATSISNIPAGNLAATDIQGAVNELQGDIDTLNTALSDHLVDAIDAHDASAISNIPAGNLAATDLQGAVNELQSDIDTRALDSALTDHLNDAVDAHDASAISNIPAGSIAATDVQAALNELDGDITTHVGSTVAHGATGAVVGTTNTQTLTNKTITSPIITGADFRTPTRSDVKQDTKANLTTYALTASNGQLAFATDTKEMFQVVDTLLKAVGSGGGVGNVDALLTQTFDTSALGDFTQTGLILATTPRINGAQTARLIHQAGVSPTNDQSFKQIISVDRKYRGKLMQLSLQDRSTASEGNLVLKVRNETGAADIIVSDSIQTDSQSIAAISTTSASAVLSGFSNSVINGLSIGMSVTGAGIPTGTTILSINTALLQVTMSANATASASITIRVSALPLRRVFSFTAPKDCASLSYTITALPEAGLPESYIDDLVIQLASTALLETSVTVPVLTAWQSYTPTFQGFGPSPTNIQMQWRQNGQNAEIRGKFTSDVPTAVEARVGLPAGLSSAGTEVIPSLQVCSGSVLFYSVNGSVIRQALIEPSVSYLTFGEQALALSGLNKANGSAVSATGTFISFSASVPCAGLSATVDKVIPLTQSGLIQEADSMVRLNTTNGYGSTNTNIRRFSTLINTLGSDILYQDSATLGASFTVLKSGIYNITFTDQFSSAHWLGISLNSTSAISSSGVAALAMATSYAANVVQEATWEGYLSEGDVIRANTDGVSSGTNPTRCQFTISRQGSLKQVSVSSDQKIKIPTSELRFEGASSRGTGSETFIVQFDNLAKVRGDAFSISNSNGTSITILKNGRLSVGSTIIGVGGSPQYMTRNQATRTALPSVTETLARGGNAVTTTSFDTSSWTGSVSIGDIIRISMDVNPTSSSYNLLQLSFQEQDISVSVTNTLPQFSDSDSSVRVDTANGYGSTATKIRRFSNVRDNLGVDVEYVDSATNGASFTAKSDGTYNISFTDGQLANGNVSISKNASSLTTNPSSLSISELLSSSSQDTASFSINTAWSGVLQAGDIIRPHTTGVATGATNVTSFTMSKVGKPNVTGVDVTAFVNVPQPESQSVVFSNAAVTTSNLISVGESKGSGLFSLSASGVFTAIKRCTIFASVTSINASTTTRVTAQVIVDGIVKASGVNDTANNSMASTASYAQELNVGQTVQLLISGISTAATGSLVATALSDQILTVPETFSTDTAALSYAGSAEYTLATLENAPVGKYITFTYAASTNTRTQTTVRPTQTDADMNANGLQIFTRAYNVLSTAALPAAFAIQIGKGLKGKSLDLYKSAGKVTGGELDFSVVSTTLEFGIRYKGYNESTGILLVDLGERAIGTTSAILLFSDLTFQTNGYLVINASKNPALVGISLPRVYSESAGNAAQVITANVTNIPFIGISDTNGAWNGSQYVVPETGFYTISGNVYSNAVAKNLYLYENGSQTRIIATQTPETVQKFEVTKLFTKGQVLSIRTPNGCTLVSGSSILHYINITKVSN